MSDKKISILAAAGTVLAAMLLLSVSPPPSFGQATDPFYHKWLESGEAAFYARSYAQAAESLEIAVFGLVREKEAQSRGYVFLALCRAALGQAEPASAALTAAARNIGWDALRAMDLRIEARGALDRLLVKHSPKAAAASKPVEEKKKVEVISIPEEKPAEKPLPKTGTETPPAEAATVLPETKPESGVASMGDLRKAIKDDPRNPGAYYDLAYLQRQVRDYEKAQETLELLIGRNPAEIRAHLEIGRIAYLSGNAKAAVKELEKFLSLTANVSVGERYRDEGLALLLLSTAARKDQKKLAALLRQAEDLFRPERLEKLTLDPADLERLRALRKPAVK